MTIVAQAKEKYQPCSYKKVLTTTDNIFTLPEEISESAPYSPKTLPEEKLWFHVKNFSERDFYPKFEFLGKGFSSVEYPQISRNDLDTIEFLYAHKNNDYFFQNVTKSKRLRLKGIFYFGDSFKYVDDQKGITINPYPHAIYRRDEDTLYFQNLNCIKTIFDGIDDLYRKATQEETEFFITSNPIECVGAFGANGIGTLNRKRIAQIMDQHKDFFEKHKDQFVEYIKKYHPEIEIEKGTFHISSDKDLKHLLYGIEERYFDGHFTKEKHQANSIIPI